MTERGSNWEHPRKCLPRSIKKIVGSVCSEWTGGMNMRGRTSSRRLMRLCMAGLGDVGDEVSGRLKVRMRKLIRVHGYCILNLRILNLRRKLQFMDENQTINMVA